MWKGGTLEMTPKKLERRMALFARRVEIVPAALASRRKRPA